MEKAQKQRWKRLFQRQIRYQDWSCFLTWAPDNKNQVCTVSKIQEAFNVIKQPKCSQLSARDQQGVLSPECMFLNLQQENCKQTKMRNLLADNVWHIKHKKERIKKHIVHELRCLSIKNTWLWSLYDACFSLCLFVKMLSIVLLLKYAILLNLSNWWYNDLVFCIKLWFLTFR